MNLDSPFNDLIEDNMIVEDVTISKMIYNDSTDVNPFSRRTPPSNLMIIIKYVLKGLFYRNYEEPIRILIQQLIDC